ncbi:MAG TPA: DUF2911 domain-containing protein [Terriglobia bacterium]|nr:DUF2911 domain-containing protein [Terriglobia bacterium]
MKRLRNTGVVLAVVFGLSAWAQAQGNPRGNSKITLAGQTISVEYGRPSLKGRTVQTLLGQLKPGGFWRLGADKSTTFTTSTDLNFGGVKVPKGVYSLWAQRQADNSWKLVFNSQHGQWGTSHAPSKDVVFVPLKEEKESKPAQMVTISLEKEHGGGAISISWGDMELSANFTVES